MFRLALAAALAAAPAAAAAEQWAVVVGVKSHANPRLDLRYTDRDAEAVAAVLAERAGLDPKTHILQLTDSAPPERRPTGDNIRRLVPEFLRRAKAGDRVIFYFSGHGVAEGGETYLVPSTYDRARPAATGVPLTEVGAWLGPRGCAAATKFLILDCCHAGVEAAGKSATLQDVAPVRAIPGAVLLASCGADEKSYEWDARRHGVFTYWLCRALQGAATNGDGRVTLAGLLDYLPARVSDTSEAVHGAAQNPQQYGAARRNEALLALSPEPEEAFCRRLAEDLDLDARRAKAASVGVLEFFMPVGQDPQELGRSRLPRWLAERVAARLTELAGGDYRVIGPGAMAAVAASKDIVAAEVRREENLRQLGAAAVAFGVIRRQGAAYTVEVELVDAAGKSLGRAGGRAHGTAVAMPAERVADMPGSGSVNLQTSPGAGAPADSYDPERVRLALRTASGSHLAANPNFPFKVEAWVAPPGGGPFQLRAEQTISRTDKAGSLLGTEAVIPVRLGERLEVRVTSRRSEPTAVRLYLDAFNSLGKGRDLTGKGPGWVIPPAATCAVGGWYTRKPNGAYTKEPFQFVDLKDSVAGRSGFTQGIGVITAAFYEQGKSGLAVGSTGQIINETLKEKEFAFGGCLGVLNLRYVDADEWERRPLP